MKNIGQDMISSFEIIRRISGDKWKVLAENLRELEHLGILYRVTYDDPIPRVEYSLTSIGYSLQPVFQSLILWSLNYATAYKEQLRILEEQEAAGTKPDSDSLLDDELNTL